MQMQPQTFTVKFRGQTFAVPSDATFFPNSPVFPGYRDRVIASIKDEVSNENRNTTDVFQGACNNWMQANTRNRDMKLPIQPKPIAPRLSVVYTQEIDEAISTADAIQQAQVFAMPGVPFTPGGVFVWQRDGELAGECADLPAVPPALKRIDAPAHVRNVPEGDVMPIGFVVSDPADGSQWQKQASPTPFGTAVFYARLAAVLLVVLALLSCPTHAAESDAAAPVIIAPAGGIVITLQPDSMAILPFDHFPIGPWNLRACNYTSVDRSLPEEEIFQALQFAAPNVRLLTAQDATLVLSGKQSKSKPAVVAQIIGYGLNIAGPLLGFQVIKAAPRIVGAIVSAQTLAPLVQTEAQRLIPSILPYTSNLLAGMTDLSAARAGGDPQCTTRRVFGAKMKSPPAVSVVLPALK